MGAGIKAWSQAFRCQAVAGLKVRAMPFMQ